MSTNPADCYLWGSTTIPVSNLLISFTVEENGVLGGAASVLGARPDS